MILYCHTSKNYSEYHFHTNLNYVEFSDKFSLYISKICMMRSPEYVIFDKYAL